mgnify:CR=1 FL=1
MNEANFSRMLYVRCLKDIVEWHVIKLIPDAVSWGFAMSNLQQPFHAAPSPHNGGRDGEADVSSGDEGNDSQESSRECMSSSEDDDVSEYDEAEEDNASGQIQKRLYSPDRSGVQRVGRSSPDRKRRKRI